MPDASRLIPIFFLLALALPTAVKAEVSIDVSPMVIELKGARGFDLGGHPKCTS